MPRRLLAPTVAVTAIAVLLGGCGGDHAAGSSAGPANGSGTRTPATVGGRPADDTATASTEGSTTPTVPATTVVPTTAPPARSILSDGGPPPDCRVMQLVEYRADVADLVGLSTDPDAGSGYSHSTVLTGATLLLGDASSLRPVSLEEFAAHLAAQGEDEATAFVLCGSNANWRWIEPAPSTGGLPAPRLRPDRNLCARTVAALERARATGLDEAAVTRLAGAVFVDDLVEGDVVGTDAAGPLRLGAVGLVPVSEDDFRTLRNRDPNPGEAVELRSLDPVECVSLHGE